MFEHELGTRASDGNRNPKEEIQIQRSGEKRIHRNRRLIRCEEEKRLGRKRKESKRIPMF